MMSENAFLEAALAMKAQIYYVAKSILWNENDAADAVQEAMLKGWKMRSQLNDDKRFNAWFMRIVVNQCRDIQRRQLREKKALCAYTSDGTNHLNSVENHDMLGILITLPEKLRLPTLLYYFDGYSQKDIANIVGISSEQVKTRIRQARTQMKKIMLEEDERK